MRRHGLGWRPAGAVLLMLPLWLSLGSVPAAAHAILVDSSPAISAAVPAGDVALRLRFNSRVDRARSRLTLMRADHSTEILPIGPTSTDDVLVTKATLAPGSYIVRWQVLAIDGHITRGDVPFTTTATDGTK